MQRIQRYKEFVLIVESLLILAQHFTLQDVQNIQPGQQPTWFSQVVVTLKITNTSLTSPTSGQIEVSLRYNQTDQNIGDVNNYPYGNFD